MSSFGWLVLRLLLSLPLLLCSWLQLFVVVVMVVVALLVVALGVVKAVAFL